MRIHALRCSDPIPVPLRKPATVLKIETIQGRDTLTVAVFICRQDSKAASEDILATAGL
jgi:hypothetical protein